MRTHAFARPYYNDIILDIIWVPHRPQSITFTWTDLHMCSGAAQSFGAKLRAFVLLYYNIYIYVPILVPHRKLVQIGHRLPHIIVAAIYLRMCATISRPESVRSPFPPILHLLIMINVRVITVYTAIYYYNIMHGQQRNSV